MTSTSSSVGWGMAPINMLSAHFMRHILCGTKGVKKSLMQHQLLTDLSTRLCVLDVFATRQMHALAKMFEKHKL